jgi:hypothetical protein
MIIKYVQLRNNVIVDNPVLYGRDKTTPVILLPSGKAIKLVSRTSQALLGVSVIDDIG